MSKLCSKTIVNLKLQWDEPLPPEISKGWQQTTNTLSVIECVEFPRKQGKQIEITELHGFSDTSFQAYEACIYLRRVYESKEVKANLVTAKFRVGPLKEMSISRLCRGLSLKTKDSKLSLKTI